MPDDTRAIVDQPNPVGSRRPGRPKGSKNKPKGATVDDVCAALRKQFDDKATDAQGRNVIREMRNILLTNGVKGTDVVKF